MKLPRRKMWRAHLWVLLCLVLAYLAYQGVLAADFVGFDDNLYVSANRIVQQGLTKSGLHWAVTATYASTWQPLVWLSYMLDVTLQGYSPASFHRTNLLLHLLQVFLVYWAVRKLTRNPLAAALASLLLAIHPVHVESVAWIAERKGLLSSIFWWLALLAYLSFTQTHLRKYYLLTLGAMALGLMAKPMLVTLPLILLLIDLWPARRFGPPFSRNQLASCIREKIPFLALSLASAAITSYAQQKGGSFLGLDTIPLWGRIGNAVVSIWRYLWHIIAPVRLAVLYPHPVQWPAWLVLPGLTLLVLCIYLIYAHRKSYPWVAWGCAWFLLTLSPVLGLNQFGWHAMADRFLYLPAVGLYIAIGVSITPLFRQYRRGVTIMSVVVVLVLSMLTHRQAGYWHNSITLFSRAVQVTRNNWMMHNSLGAALTRAGRYTEAIPHFGESIRINPRNAKAYFNLGHVRFVQEQWDEAAALFEQSIALSPNYQAQFNLAVTHSRRGAHNDAKQAYLTLLERHPRHMHSLLNLGRLYRKTDNPDQAIACYRLVLETDPDNQDARTGLAISMLAKADDPMPAIAMLVRLLEEDASNLDAREALNKAIHGTGTNRTP